MDCVALSGILNLHLLGTPRATVNGRDVPIPSASAQMLMGYLTLCPNQSENRGTLAALLWEESTETHARQNLRQTLHRLRHGLDTLWGGLVADKVNVALARGRVCSDTEDLLTALAAGTVPETLLDQTRIAERLLETAGAPGEMFSSWLRLRRRQFESALRAGLEKLLDGPAPETCERAARALLNLDPSDENSARYLMKFYHDRGDTGRALVIHAALEEHLDAEFGMEPSAPTEELLARIRAGTPPETAPPAQAPPAAPRAENLRIGVLPIAQAPAGDEAESIANLFRIELISQMLRFREIDVIDTTMRETPTDYSLRLSVAQSNDQLALIALMTRGSDGQVVWSDRHEQVTENWWHHQALLAGNLAAACSLSLSRARQFEISSMSTVPRAVDNWILGQQCLQRFRGDDDAPASEYFHRAIELDPNFSKAYSSLSQLLNGVHLVMPGRIRDPETHRRSRTLANQAISLDPMDSRAHLHRAWASCLLGEYSHAAASFAMARQCNPNDPWTTTSSALGAAFCEDEALALELEQRGLAEGWVRGGLEWAYITVIRFLRGDNDGCVAAAENAGTYIHNIPAWRACALWLRGDAEAAQQAWAEYDSNVRAQWAVDEPPTPERVLDWFLSGFPIRSAATRQRMAGAARAVSAATAAAHYRHCEQI